MFLLGPFCDRSLYLFLNMDNISVLYDRGNLILQATSTRTYQKDTRTLRKQQETVENSTLPVQNTFV